MGVVLTQSVGTSKRVQVAAKAPKQSADVVTKALEDFREEMELMGTLHRLGGHRNVVKVVGLVAGCEPLLVLEFCDLGCLKEVLESGGSQLLGRPHEPSTTARVIRAMTGYGIDISMGMAFLAQHKFVHRDLAARNVLVARTDTASVQDGAEMAVLADSHRVQTTLPKPSQPTVSARLLTSA